MLLAIDVGNSHMVIGLFDHGRLTHHWRMATNRNSTADELAARFHSLFALGGTGFTDIDGVVLASVVPTMQTAWVAFTRQYLGRAPLVVDGRLDTGMRMRTDHPEEVGADRIVNAVAGYAQFDTSLIIVDFGTAITLDCVSAQGDYLGGAIAPGLAISQEALSSRTARLPRVDVSSPPAAAIGTNTVDAMKAGLLYGFGGLVEGLINRIKAEFAPDRPKVIATGGMAEIIAPYAPSIEAVLPMLTLEGLRILHERNA
ncbi:MAG: pantothenate kinase [Deltaproteobacteria bacterium CG23_combo_of_CG06-09_8_20_14_all_60_8]|nr:MAG: type III pantothenate kinase [Desulfobacterales bacterium CG2_30_60_27]PIP42792.1 MAG: pantothenate kinase [Deltaproteobacteria bacterium CG23_combo_of_CG06-09_8_20_14_all_60_8]